MSLTPSWHSSISKTLFSQSIELQYTPTTGQAQYFQQSSSMISLSHYLQRDESTIHFYQNPSQNKQKTPQNKHSKKNIHKNKSTLGCQILQQNHYPIQPSSYQDQPSQSFLLLDSTIKQKKVFQQNQNQNENQIQKPDHQKQISINILKTNSSKQIQIFRQIDNQQSRISQNTNYRNGFGQSMELLELLAFSKSNEEIIIKNNKENKNIEAIGKQKQEDDIKKLKNMYFQLLNSYQELTGKINNFNLPQLVTKTTQNTQYQFSQNLPNSLCPSCTKTKQQHKSLLALIQSQTNQIKKYNSIIESLNSQIFDLKMENKKLSYENSQYVQYIEKLYTEPETISSIKSLERINSFTSLNHPSNLHNKNHSIYEEEPSLSQRITTQEQNVSSSHKQIFGYNRNFIEQDEYSRADLEYKIYPQTPHPISNYSKNKKCGHRRIGSNYSDKNVQLGLAISQLKEPSLYQIAENKANRIIKKEEENRFDIYQLPTQKYLLSQNQQLKLNENKPRFSDLSNKLPSNRASNYSNSIPTSPNKNIISSGTPKMTGFLKLKNKDSSISTNQVNKNYNKKSPLKKLNDNDSESSETKTQKIQYKKNKFIIDKHQADMNSFNDYNNFFNFNQNHPQIPPNRLSTNRFIRQKPEFTKSSDKKQPKNKSPIIYKSFKQIGALSQINYSSEQNQQKLSKPIFPGYQNEDYQPQVNLFKKNTIFNLQQQQKNKQKSERFYSPSGCSNYSNSQNYVERGNNGDQISSPYLKRKEKTVKIIMR